MAQNRQKRLKKRNENVMKNLACKDDLRLLQLIKINLY
jgi:hypothetical protein